MVQGSRAPTPNNSADSNRVSPSAPAERKTQLLTDNNFCSFYSRTQVACSKPPNGNYGQAEVDRRNTARSAGGKNPDPVAQLSRLPTIPSMACANLDNLTNAIRRNPNSADAMSSGPSTQR